MFESVNEILDKAIRLSYDDAFKFALDSNIKDEIVRLNTREQLYNQGVDSEGEDIGDYSPFTIEKKKEKGQRHDHITISDSFGFYDSFKAFRTGSDITITADDVADYDIPLTTVFGDEIIGLTDESLQIIINLIIPRLKLYIENTLGI